jgi:acetate kinase
LADLILAINAGSSTIKLALFAIGVEEPRLVAKTLVEDKGKELRPLVDAALSELEAKGDGGRLVGIGHRIVHGGTRFAEPVQLTDEVVEAVAALTPLAPLHQPRSLEPVEITRALRPDVPQFACFDTAFHRTIGRTAARYALPRDFENEDGIKKYGFHGLSYEHIARCLGEASAAEDRTVVAHLGNGASLCAMRGGASHDTTMGFSPLDGLVMGTRCGGIDPGVLIYLMRQHRLDADGLERLLYRECGLLGVSGLSSDVRTLEASGDERAEEALALFVFRIVRETAAMAATLGGLDRLVFTGGIGEHSAAIREKAAKGLAWLGVAIDPARNESASPRLDAEASRVAVHIIPADEELTIARHVTALTRVD